MEGLDHLGPGVPGQKGKGLAQGFLVAFKCVGIGGPLGCHVQSLIDPVWVLAFSRQGQGGHRVGVQGQGEGFCRQVFWGRQGPAKIFIGLEGQFGVSLLQGMQKQHFPGPDPAGLCCQQLLQAGGKVGIVLKTAGHQSIQ